MSLLINIKKAASQASDVIKQAAAKADEDQTESLGKAATFEMERLKVRVESERLKKYKRENKIRVQLIKDVLHLTVVWMIFVAIIITAVGLGKMHFSTSVMITIITTLTTEMLGFFYLVLKYLYNEKQIENYQNG